MFRVNKKGAECVSCSPASISLQYMGDSAPEKVKVKIVEMLYSWTAAFPNEAKIAEAYKTLKSQGVLT